MKKKTAACLGACLVLVLCAALWWRYGGTYQETGFAMDTIIRVSAKGPGARDAVKDCFAEAARVERQFSAYQEDSEIAAINQTAHRAPVKASGEVFSLLLTAQTISDDTQGAFDITLKPLVDLWDIKSGRNFVPDKSQTDALVQKTGMQNLLLDKEAQTVFLKNDVAKLDLGGIAKGYCADRMAAILQDAGVASAIVNLGGNIYVLGKNPSTIGLQDPNGARGEYFGTVDVKNTSVVTSGAYERSFVKDGVLYHHILNPFDGRCAKSGVVSATVIGENSAMCDAYATAIYVLGVEEGMELIQRTPGLSCVIVDEANQVYVSDGLSFSLTNHTYKQKG